MPKMVRCGTPFDKGACILYENKKHQCAKQISIFEVCRDHECACGETNA